MDFVNDIMNVISQINSIIGAFMSLAGLVGCYFGYKIFKIQCGIVGFALGFILGMGIGTSSTQNIGIGVLCGIVLGALFAFVAVKVYYIGVYIFHGMIGTVIIGLLTALFGGDGGTAVIIGMIGGIVVGIISVIYAKFIIIYSSSVAGGSLAATGLMAVFSSDNIGIQILLSGLFIITGIVYQYKSNKGKLNKSNDTSLSDDISQLLPQSNTAEELKKSKELLDKGILSQDEFNEIKRKLIEKL